MESEKKSVEEQIVLLERTVLELLMYRENTDRLLATIVENLEVQDTQLDLVSDLVMKLTDSVKVLQQQALVPYLSPDKCIGNA